MCVWSTHIAFTPLDAYHGMEENVQQRVPLTDTGHTSIRTRERLQFRNTIACFFVKEGDDWI